MRNIFQSLYENVCFFPVQWSVHARSPDSVARGYQSMQSRWKSEYNSNCHVSTNLCVFLSKEGNAMGNERRRKGEVEEGKKLTLSVFSPVSRKYGPQRNSANAFWMYYTDEHPDVSNQSRATLFHIAFSSQSISCFVPSANISLRLGMSH